ncbi:AAA family ATPase [Candidatus Enterococcus lemimoniae]|uniref:NadR/Ttd14 AAA domain-containing protein n=1 Tax=Candidatus Enterococcus lemimoniae TaxID=1834167 RepID=A0ABZ2T796_9ENTE|nr:AAA family ATPase [Enterococcus sp. 12C11_DIV0727]OTO70874.1 hypothetical protein A5866_003124 [Enterococcus sp. 12C11_DIV0727]
MGKKEIRLVISGTYSTGKTTTTTALSIATGIPLINALSAREILTDLYPGRRFQDMNATELLALGLKRMEERIREEMALYQTSGSFISDGSVMNEWIYGTVRMKVGINPGSSFSHRMAKAVLGLPARGFFKKYLDAYGQVANQHAKQWYTDAVHLPIEFEMDSDGHRPVSEKYRVLSDQELKNAFISIGLEPNLVTGNQIERVKKIVELYHLPLVVPVEEAVKLAQTRIQKNREAVAQRIIEQYSEPGLKEKFLIMTKY